MVRRELCAAVVFLMIGLTLAGSAGASQREISETLTSSIQNRGLRISGEARGRLEEVARAGADQLAADKNSVRGLSAAKDSAKRLANEIVAVANEGGDKVVTVKAIDDAMRRICPLYPFCRSRR